MSVLGDLQRRAASHPAHIVLSEGHDPRIVAAAIKAVSAGLGTITLVGDATVVQGALDVAGGAQSEKLRIADPSNHPRAAVISERFHALRQHKGVTLEQAQTLIRDPLIFAAMLVAMGEADGTVGGAVATTSDTVRAALQVIGKAANSVLVSSFFLMVLPEGHVSGRRAMIFSDCGLVIDPSAQELTEIAAQSAASCQALMDETPKVAFLSFSTKGSARHAAVSKVSEAAQMLKEARSDILSDGELQFDAAFAPEIAASKAMGSDVAGQANVMIFPNLDAGNIGYKIAQRIGGCVAIGPILQGLAKPANDLSRGCTADDVLHMIAVTALQAAALKETT